MGGYFREERYWGELIMIWISKMKVETFLTWKDQKMKVRFMWIDFLQTRKNKMNTKNSCSCCPPDSNQVFNDNIFSKAKVPNKTKIKTASRILKKLSFKVLGTVSEEQAMIDVRNRDQKVEYIPVSTVNSGWLEDHNNVMKLRNSSSKLYLVLA